MDWQLIEHKLDSLHRAVKRVSQKCPSTPEELIADVDTQDILALNLTRAVQISVDIGAHIIASTEFPPPATMGETFDILAQASVIDQDLATDLKRSVGFRNLAVHNYQAIDWHIVFAIAKNHLQDFTKFAKAIVAYAS